MAGIGLHSGFAHEKTGNDLRLSFRPRHLLGHALRIAVEEGQHVQMNMQLLGVKFSIEGILYGSSALRKAIEGEESPCKIYVSDHIVGTLLDGLAIQLDSLLIFALGAIDERQIAECR